MIYLSIILRNNFGATSLLKEDLMEKELIVGLRAGREIFQDVVTIELLVETKYPKEIIPLLKEKMNNLLLSKDDLKRRIRCNIAALINDLDDIEFVNTDIVDQLITYGKIEDNMYDLYRNLELDKVNDIIKKIDTTHNSTVVLIPFKEK